MCLSCAIFHITAKIIFLQTQARRYDSRTTIFSPEGRLYQVEYAMEAISHAGTCLGILAEDGIVLAAECRSTNKLLDNAIPSEKIYKLNEWVKSKYYFSDYNSINILLQEYGLFRGGHHIRC